MWILWGPAFSETYLSVLPELEVPLFEFLNWTIHLRYDNWLSYEVFSWWLTMNSLNEVRWCFLYFVLRFFTQFSNTQCLQWFVEGIVWFENPLYDSSKLHRTTSDWTVYNGSQIEVNRSRSTFRMSFVLKSSELLLYSSKIWVTECGRG